MNTTNSIVTDKIHEHIASYFNKEAGWDSDDWEINLAEQIISMRINGESDYTTAQRLVTGGSFLIYYWDVKDFLNGLGINPTHKEYTDEASWKLYIHLLAREISKIFKSI